MASITRTKLLMAAAATTLVFAVGAHQSQAATSVGTTALSADTALTTSATGVTSGTAFPDGSKTANCFILITDKGDHTPTTKPYGSCTGDAVTAVQTSYVVDASLGAVADQHGAALQIDGSGVWTYAYDAGPKYGANGSFAKTNLQVNVTNNSGERLVFLLNQDSGSTARNGCFNYVDAGGEAAPSCFANATTGTAGGSSGTFYEVQTQAGTGVMAEASAASGTGSSGNIPVEGVFFLPASTTGGTATVAPTAAATSTAVSSVGTPTATNTPVSSVGTPSPTTPVLAASYVRVHRSSGVTHLKWYSTDHVRGFNVFDGHTRISKHLVTSHSHWYHFNTRHVFHHLRLVGR